MMDMSQSKQSEQMWINNVFHNKTRFNKPKPASNKRITPTLLQAAIKARKQ